MIVYYNELLGRCDDKVIVPPCYNVLYIAEFFYLKRQFNYSISSLFVRFKHTRLFSLPQIKVT